jgi:hypothetical protein
MGKAEEGPPRPAAAEAAAQAPFPKGLARPALRALAGAGYENLEQLSSATEASLLELHGLGPNALAKLRSALQEIGLSFANPDSGTMVSAPDGFGDIWSEEAEVQGKAFREILTLTAEPVGWAYAVWDELLKRLTDRNNRSRSIAAQVLCNLAKSDPSKRLLRDFPALFAVTRDERFVTARHCLQSLWEVGCVGKEQQVMLVAALESRFSECVTHKNCTLIRHDIIECLRKLFDAVQDAGIKGRAMALIELEGDPKYKKKYSTLWPKQSS